MRTYAREYGEISKKQFSRVTSRGLQWENKIYKLKRSIAPNASVFCVFGMVNKPFFSKHSYLSSLQMKLVFIKGLRFLIVVVTIIIECITVRLTMKSHDKFLKRGCSPWGNCMRVQRTAERTISNRKNAGSNCTNRSWPLWYKWRSATSRPHRLIQPSSERSKRRDLHLKWLHRETNNNTLHYYWTVVLQNPWVPCFIVSS